MPRHTSLPFSPLILLVAILAGGILLRLLLLRHELWFDELWSMSLAAKVQHPLDVFTNIHHDNNHYINTLYLSFIGPFAPWWVYHVPSFLAGSLLLIIASAWVYKRNQVEGLIVALLLATSFLFVRYSTEARGFMPMMLFGFLSFLSLKRFLKSRSAWDAGLFWLSSIIAFLWHLTFLVGYLPFLVWSGIALQRKGDLSLPSLAILHLPILLFLLILTVVDIRLMQVGGSVFHPSVGEVIVMALATLLGATSEIRQPSFFAWVVGVPAFGAILVSLHRSIRRWISDKSLRMVVIWTTLPCLLLLLLAPTMLMPRYFFPLLLLLTLGLGHIIRLWIEKKRAMHFIGLGALLAVALGNMWHVTLLYQNGDRQFFSTIQTMMEETESGTTIEVASNTKRGNVPVSLLAARIDQNISVDFFPPPLLPAHPPQWFLWDNDVFPDAPSSFVFLDQTYERQPTGESRAFWTLYKRS